MDKFYVRKDNCLKIKYRIVMKVLILAQNEKITAENNSMTAG